MSSFIEVFLIVLSGVLLFLLLVSTAMASAVLQDKINTELRLVRDRWLINREMKNSPSWQEE